MNGRFLNIINSNKPVLVDFFADWCQPCKQMSPILKEVKSELKENVRIIKVNVDKNPAIATRYQIRSIPTVIVFKNGEPIWKGIGLQPACDLKTILRKHING
ncbi:MAG TPA: thioredoxin [Draconibacterium sp.]|nr:thioredoxin [Draconibacterium sp.]